MGNCVNGEKEQLHVRMRHEQMSYCTHEDEGMGEMNVRFNFEVSYYNMCIS